MKNSSKEIALKWLKQTEFDSKDAKKAFEWQSYNLCYFLAQQEVRMVLKALLYYVGAEEIWGQSAGILLIEATKYYPELESLLPQAKSLDKYYIPTRYPDALPDEIVPSEAYDSSDGESALSKAERILSKVRSLIIN
ncbi:MAG: HEPN domain-containing protein [Caldimicrobium sp.]|nr:HEPN domain-containing protein [Caldimicrobium sp.]MDW8183136.1 HEPN domain-containing protein [Caldimicrobium sp.]